MLQLITLYILLFSGIVAHQMWYTIFNPSLELTQPWCEPLPGGSRGNLHHMWATISNLSSLMRMVPISHLVGWDVIYRDSGQCFYDLPRQCPMFPPFARCENPTWVICIAALLANHYTMGLTYIYSNKK